MGHGEPIGTTSAIEPQPINQDIFETAHDHYASEASRLDLGANFGRYVVVRPLGQGGMGVVYLAYDPQLDRGVALKVLRPDERASEQTSQARLLREAQAMAKLSHPNVLPVYDVGTVGTNIFVAMEYVDGPTLSDWLTIATPSWLEVLDVFIAAGRGLAAAHAAGMVHRDFKPDNVMIDRNGRPRVMDFGLARVSEGHGTTQTQSSEPCSASISSTSVDLLTRTGVILGTPAYMAPEQHLGNSTDPTGDQFSYCVALYQGLYAERPFAGTTAAALYQAAMNREVQPAPAGSKVPGWLRRIVLRGLCPHPSERWPSIDALLGALLRHRHRARRRRTTLGALGMVGAMAAVGVWWQYQADQPCSGGDGALETVWHQGTRRSITDAFTQTGLSFAPQTAQRTIQRIDAWSRNWVDEYRNACEATHVRNEQSGMALDLRMRCLQEQRGALHALTKVLSTADPQTVEHAIDAVEQLPRTSYCADFKALQAEFPLPDDAQKVQTIEQTQSMLHQIDALIVAARFEEAHEILTQATIAAQSLGHPPLDVQLGLREGQLLEIDGELDNAVELLESTLWHAEIQGMDRMAASVAIKLLWMDGALRSHHARAETWVALAEAKIHRLGSAPDLRANLIQRRADLADSQGHYDQAADDYRIVLELREADGSSPTVYAHALGDFGKTHYRAGRYAEAAATFERAGAVIADTMGPWHPDVAKLKSNAAAAYHTLGDYPRAQEHLESSLQILEQAYGPDHLSLSISLTNLGNTYYRQGEYQRAIEAGRRAIRIKEANLGPLHPKVGINLNNIAMALSQLGHHNQALQSYRDAEHSIAALGPEHIGVVEPLLGQGEELLTLARAAEAIEPLRRAYEHEKSHGHDPLRQALPAFLLARALREHGGHRAEVEALISTARSLVGDNPSTPEGQRVAEGLRHWPTKPR